MMGQSRGRTLKYKIERILEALKTNRDEHQEIVEEAQEAFRKAAIEEMEKMLEDARKGKPIRTNLSLTVPRSFLREYDNAIEMLEATQEDGTAFIELTSDEWERFVKNRWHWTQEFGASNAAYTDKAAKFRS